MKWEEAMKKSEIVRPDLNGREQKEIAFIIYVHENHLIDKAITLFTIAVLTFSTVVLLLTR